MPFSTIGDTRRYFKFTGPAEHWLTALQHKSWGFKEKDFSSWEKIQAGDVFFLHNTGTSDFAAVRSGIFGIGIASGELPRKDEPLWIQEVEAKENIWPLLVPFSEIYIFGHVPSLENWKVSDLNNQHSTQILVDGLLENLLPLNELPGFPAMGGFSSVKAEVAAQILHDRPNPTPFESTYDEFDFEFASEPLRPVGVLSETIRSASGLKDLTGVGVKIIRDTKAIYTRDSKLLAHAEIVHSSILEKLINMFNEKGFKTLSNKYIDLFAYNNTTSFLIEAKSTENKNFRSQVRKGIIQLFEYDHFEIQKCIADNNLNFKNSYKILALSQAPEDLGYIEFINDLGIYVILVSENTITNIGRKFDFIMR